VNRNYQNPFGDEEFSQHNRCRGKVAYPSKRHARGAVRVMRKARGVEDTDRLNAYSCPDCRRWHIGNSRWRSQPAS
jgi:hypothetical protein